jgi:small subunit ribosomal protein S20
MANLKSSKKDIRRTAKRTLRNRSVRAELKTLAKRVQGLRSGEDPTAAKSAAIDYVSALDKAAKHGVIHPNRATRHKSSLSKLIFG